MGKAIMIMVTGVLIVMGTFQVAVQNRMLMADHGVAEKAWRTAAYTNANSAIESAAQRIMLEPTWALNGGTHSEIYPEGEVEVTVTRTGSTIRLRAISVVEDATVRIEAMYSWTTDTFFPDADAAMGIYSENLSFNIAGSAFSISGYDYFTDGSINPDGNTVPGIGVDHGENIGLINSSLNDNQKNKITGTDGSPSIKMLGDSNASIDEIIEMLTNNADVVYTGEYIAQGAGSLGTRENPQIVVVEGDLKVSNATGAGILIVKEGGEMDIRGNLDHYEGIIIVQGTARLVRGNINVYGAMIFGGDDPELVIDIDLRGNVHIRYSSEVLEFLQNALSSRFHGKMTLLGVYQ
jgi:hypothetical protein